MGSAMQQNLNSGQREGVVNGHRIQVPKIVTHPPLLVLLWDEQYRSSPGADRRLNPTLVIQFPYLLMHRVQFVGR